MLFVGQRVTPADGSGAPSNDGRISEGVLSQVRGNSDRRLTWIITEKGKFELYTLSKLTFDLARQRGSRFPVGMTGSWQSYHGRVRRSCQIHYGYARIIELERSCPDDTAASNFSHAHRIEPVRLR